MAIRKAQLELGKATVLDRVFRRYSQCRDPIIRVVIESVKKGTLIEQQVGKKILQQAYQSIHARSPEGDHGFRHWLQDAVQADDEHTIGLSIADAFIAETIEVIP